MFKIWAKIINGDKIALSRIIEFEDAFKKADFYQYLTEICRQIDVSVPIVLKKHINHFIKFNNTRFFSTDFVEPTDFSALLIENVPLGKKKNP